MRAWATGRGPGLLNGAALALTLLWLGVLFTLLQPGPDDFRTYWQGAANLAAGGDPYRLAQPGPDGNGTGYFYPPLFAFLIQPLAWLDYETAQRLWFGLNALALLAMVALCIRVSGSVLAARHWGVVTLLFAVFVPTRLNLQLGQIALFMGLAMIVPAARLARPAASGALLALAVATRVFPGLLALPMLLWRETRSLAWALAWGLAVTGLLLSAHGWAPFRAFLSIAGDAGLPYPFQADHNVSFFGFVSRLLAPGDYTAAPLADLPWLVVPLTLALSGLAVGATLAATWRCTDRALGVAAWLCALMLVSPTNGSYTLCLLLLPALTLLRHYERLRAPWIRSGLAFCALLCNLPPTWTLASPALYLATHGGAGLLMVTPQLYGLVGFLVMLLVLARRDGRVSA